MNAAEYANLDAVEKSHWYYAGKRELVRWWLRRCGPPRPDQVLLDCGAGTGRFAKEMEADCQVLVLDNHEESLRLLRQRFRPEQIISLSGETIPLPDASLDYVTALDVLEHVADDEAVVRSFHRLLKPGGVTVVTVPTSMALWSDWDETLHHYRRYNRAQLRQLFPDKDWEIIYINYTNVAAYPIVWFVRKRRQFAIHHGIAGGVRAEDHMPSPWLNGLLQRVFVGLAEVFMPFPFGVSQVLIARKRV